MKGTKSAIRYAKALLELAIEQDKVDLVFKDMEFFVNSGANNYDLLVFLKSPVINTDKKLNVLIGISGSINLIPQTTEDESIPPESAAPTGTSLLKCNFKFSKNNSLK